MNTITRWTGIQPAFVALLALLLYVPGTLLAETEHPPIGSLRDLERRARHAQALAEQLKTMEQDLASIRLEVTDAKARISQLEAQVALQKKNIDDQTAVLTDKEEQIRRRDEMLRLFRSGAFEYYQVIDGDTLASIAGNPMVYGDKDKAIWIAYANAMEPDAELKPGTVLIIPRFTEGVNYGF